MKLAQAFNYTDLHTLEPFLAHGGVVVVDLANRFFKTRILDDGKRIRVTNLLNNEHYDTRIIGEENKYCRFVRIRTQLTRRGQTRRFEGYYVQLSYEASDLNEVLASIVDQSS